MPDLTMKRKITVKDVMGPLVRPNDGDKPTDLFTVIGHATGIRSGEDKYHAGQEFHALTGEFEAVNLATGEIFWAPQCFIPEPMHSLIVAQLTSGKVKALKFSAMVGYKYAKTSVGYEFIVKPLLKPEKSDALEELRASLPQPIAQKALPKSKAAA